MHAVRPGIPVFLQNGGRLRELKILCQPITDVIDTDLAVVDVAVLGTAFLELRDANATTRGRYAASSQPQPGAPVGDAATVHLVLPAGTYAWRLVFLLHL